MRPSIHASASADLAAVDAGTAALTRRSTVASVIAIPSGTIGFLLTSVAIVLAVLAPLLATADPFLLSGPPLSPPSMSHPLGTDGIGRDLFSGLLYATRASLLIAATVTALAFLCGTGVGLIAGYAGGIVDDALMRMTEVFQVMPRLLLIVVAIALFGSRIEYLVLALGLTSWPVLARVVRSEVLTLRDIDFVRAAQARGASPIRILWRELLPNVMPGAVALLGLIFAQMLLVEASLGFLGLGDPGTLTWGLLAGQAQGFLRVAWWLALFPGLAITLTVLGVNLLVDAWYAVLGGR